MVAFLLNIAGAWEEGQLRKEFNDIREKGLKDEHNKALKKADEFLQKHPKTKRVMMAGAAAKAAADAKRKKTEAKKAKASQEGQAATQAQQAGISGEMGGSSKITD